MGGRDKILKRREEVKRIIFEHDGIRTKEIGNMLGVRSATICLDIHAIDSFEWRDCEVYAK